MFLLFRDLLKGFMFKIEDLDHNGNLHTKIIDNGVYATVERWDKVKGWKKGEMSTVSGWYKNSLHLSFMRIMLQTRSMLLRTPELAKEDGGKSLEMQLNKYLPRDLTDRVSFKFDVLDFVGPVIFPTKAAMNESGNNTLRGTIPPEKIKLLIKDILLRTRLFGEYEIKHISDYAIRKTNVRLKKPIVARTLFYFNIHKDTISTQEERFQFVRLVKRWLNQALKKDPPPRFKNVHVQVFELIGPIKRSGRIPNETVKSNLTQWKEFAKPLGEMIRLTLIRGRICRDSEVKEISVTDVYKKRSVFEDVKIARSLVYLSSNASVFQSKIEATEKFKSLFNRALKARPERIYRNVNVHGARMSVSCKEEEIRPLRMDHGDRILVVVPKFRLPAVVP
ncbi:unnamed protein product [Calicophoron daubneyi]|uniref:Uncharacterized protein n=1 Tax=Calicophoron daubneyi TaxID=300641 RepID=A0AAV2TSA8_CALDB